MPCPSEPLDNAAYKVYTILGDGEIEEGQVWEAAMFASHYHLDNLLAIVDYNGLQIDGQLSEVCSPEPIPEKFAAFGWHVIQMDAHDFDSIEAAFAEAEQIVGQPVVIVQKSVKGKGVSFMENQVGWHGKAPNQAEYEQALPAANIANVLANGIFPEAARPAATPIILASAIPQSKNRSGYAFLKIPVLVAAARSASSTTRFS